MDVTGKPGILRIINSRLIYNSIVNEGSLSRPELSTLTGLSLPTVNKAVQLLLDDGLIVQNGELTSEGLGRKAKTYSVNEDSAHLIMVCYENEEWVCVKRTLTGRCIDQQKCAVSVRDRSELEILESVLSGFIKQDHRIAAIGIGVPGIIQSSGKVTGVPTIPAFEGVYLQQYLENRFQIPVFVENDVKLMTLGYYHEKLDETENIILVYIGNGVGAGIIINGQLYKGSTDIAGEVGYMIVDDPHSDGSRTNAEAMLSTLRRKLRASPEDSAIRNSFKTVLSKILVNIVSIIDPEAVVVSCDVLSASDAHALNEDFVTHIPIQPGPQLRLIAAEKFAEPGLYHICRQDFLSNHWLPLAASSTGGNENG